MPELEATDISHLVLNISDAVLDELTPAEAWWRDHQAWLAEKGYMLRPRYRPGWMPSWKAHPKKRRWDCEDWSAPAVRGVLVNLVSKLIFAVEHHHPRRGPYIRQQPGRYQAAEEAHQST